MLFGNYSSNLDKSIEEFNKKEEDINHIIDILTEKLNSGELDDNYKKEFSKLLKKYSESSKNIEKKKEKYFKNNSGGTHGL